MKLTLTYQGPLPATQRGISPVKAKLRQTFHPQIRAQIGHMLEGSSAPHVTTHLSNLAFVSPAHARFRTAVELDILLLSAAGTRRVGDTDNRLKTLIDGLTRPANPQQLQEFGEPVGGGPTYCLMDDDNLVNRVTMDSRQWFAEQAGPEDALVVITAQIVLGRNVDMDAPFGTVFVVL